MTSRCLPALLLAVAALLAQPGGRRVPDFGDYPVTTTYSGPRAKPKLDTVLSRTHRTAITKAVRGGKINFAGRFVVAMWGCGSNCEQYAFVDVRTGTVYSPPGTNSGFDAGYLRYRADSRLVTMDTNCDGLGTRRCDRDCYLWENQRFRHLLHMPQGAPINDLDP